MSSLTKLFRIGPNSAGPLNLAAYAATRAGATAQRWLGKYGFNSLRRFTGNALASQTLRASSHGDVLLFPALDSYSCEMFLRDSYEPEIHALLTILRDEPYSFVDCGANIGYWAVQASGASLGNHRCVAIEASASTFQLLQRNQAANQDRFLCLHGAVYDASGNMMRFDDTPDHAARHLVSDGSGGSPVVSVAIDDVVEQYLPDCPTIVVKLDIEGAEPKALGGASRTRRSRDCLFIIEDHGSDDQHRSAAACFDEGLDLWFLDAAAEATPMPDMEAVARAKVSPHVGYNFLACEAGSPLALRLGLTEAAMRASKPVRLRPPVPAGKEGA